MILLYFGLDGPFDDPFLEFLMFLVVLFCIILVVKLCILGNGAFRNNLAITIHVHGVPGANAYDIEDIQFSDATAGVELDQEVPMGQNTAQIDTSGAI